MFTSMIETLKANPRKIVLPRVTMPVFWRQLPVL